MKKKILILAIATGLLFGGQAHAQTYGYLAEFWNSITDAIVGGTTYTIEFFQQIGNSVAGAIGGIFDNLLHHFVDLVDFISYLLVLLGGIFLNLFKPLIFLLTMAKLVILALLGQAQVEVPYLTGMDNSVQGVLNVIPFWSVYSTLLYGVICMIGLWAIVKAMFRL